MIDELGKYGQLSRNIPGHTLSYWQVGGTIDWTIEPFKPQDIPEIIKVLDQKGIPWALIAGGSNLLISDQGFRGVIILLSPRWLKDDEFQLVKTESSLWALNIPSWTWVPGFALTLMKHGVADLVHTCGIPGTIGGLAYMNGGSNRKAIGSNIAQFHVADEKGNLLTLSAKECGLGYRKNELIETNRMTILSIDFEFYHFDLPSQEIREEMLSILASRRKRFPRKTPNCGSVFKSDPALYEKFGPPGKVIEDLGLKGLKVGQAEISQHHGNFILNKGGAKATDILSLIELINQSFSKHLGDKTFETEVKFLHETEGIVEISK